MSNNQIPVILPETGRPRPLSIEEIDIYHENGKGYLVGKNGEYIMMNTSDVRRHLLTLGFSSARRLPMKEVEQAIHDIQVNKSIAYSGPLAGYSAGLQKVSGKYILVTGGPTLIKADPCVDWPILRELIERLLGADNGKQLTHFYGWLKHAVIALEENRITQGQALALAGPRGCGKSLLQQVIREVLGGREANPYPYMTKATPFNRDLFGAENLMFGDEVASCDYRNRVNVGSMLKQLTANSTHRCHGKNREAVILNPLWRVTMSLNDEPSNLQVLPPLSYDSIIDKIILLKAERPSFLDQDDWLLRTREQNWARIKAELPGFVAFLHSFEIPRELADARFGIKYYQNPDLLSVLKSESPERKLLEFIDRGQLYYAPPSKTKINPDGDNDLPKKDWVGTASELYDRLDEFESMRFAVRKLLHYQSALGQYLSSLALDYPQRVKRESMIDGIQRYRLMPPPSQQKTQ